MRKFAMLMLVLLLVGSLSSVASAVQFTCNLNWNGFNSGDCGVTVIQYDNALNQLQSNVLSYNSQYTVWTGNFGVNANTTQIWYVWTVGVDQWNPENGWTNDAGGGAVPPIIINNIPQPFVGPLTVSATAH